MKKIKKLMLVLLIGIMALPTIVKADSAYTTTLDVLYGSYVIGARRAYKEGNFNVMVSVDGLRDKNNAIKTSGETRMSILVVTESSRVVGHNVSSYKVGTCYTALLGYIDEGNYLHYFQAFTYQAATDKYLYYDGVKSNLVELYPKK